ncbi:LacI family DNA-binding transcriptional regulator [Kiritimatiellota bacterium B12222]|nr:LacI family DNA-binding transcriptional regulator [Kiritimatiellota bacterium B12222]
MSSPPPSATPSMRQMAQALGISAATVSLALHNDPRVAATTRARVQEYARIHGYRLNPALTEMMSQARRAVRSEYQETLAWINNWDHPDYFISQGVDYQKLLWRGAEERANALGYKLNSFWQADPKMSGKRLSTILSARGVRGILIPPLQRPFGHLSLQWDFFTSVSLSLTLTRPRLHAVIPDHFMNMRLILRKLTHRNFQRIGLLLNQRYDDRLDNRVSAAFLHFQQTLPPDQQIPIHFSKGQVCDNNIRDWLDLHRPDAVITLGAYRHLRDLPVGDPSYLKRLGIVLLGYAQTDQGFSAVDENPYQIGKAAIDVLIASLNRNERGLPDQTSTTLINGMWVEGQTAQNPLELPS